MQQLLDGGLVSALAVNLWPSEALQVARASPACWPFWATSQALLASPGERRKLLRLVARAAGAASAAAVLAAGPKACWPRWHDGLEVLRRCGLKVHEETSAMQIALRSGPQKAVKWLLMACADAEKPVEGDLTPLRLAARLGNDELVEALLDARAQTNTRGRFGYTALMVAAMYGHLDIVQLLLSHSMFFFSLSSHILRSWGSSEYQWGWRNGHRLGLSLPRSGPRAAATCEKLWLDRQPLRKWCFNMF